MMRFWLAALLTTMIGAGAGAQTMGNPNSPREQRELRVNPPPRAPLPGQLGEIVEPERWGTLSRPVGQPTWGTIGGAGWNWSAPAYGR
jgi:hypothetical protein